MDRKEKERPKWAGRRKERTGGKENKGKERKGKAGRKESVGKGRARQGRAGKGREGKRRGTKFSEDMSAYQNTLIVCTQ